MGGGAVEGKCISYAAELLEKKESGLKTFELHEQARDDIGMICGGRVSMHFCFVPHSDELMLTLAREALHAFDAGISAYLMIDLQEHGLALLAKGESVGCLVPPEIAFLLSGAPATQIVEGKAYYLERLVRGDRVYIFGGGHVAQALVPVLASVDFRCIVIEDREEFCRKDRFAQAHDVMLMTQDEWEKKLRIGPDDCICIMTRGHVNDLDCQAFALRTRAGYIGVIGSRQKIAAVNAKLAEMGFSQVDIDRIVTPIGLEIGAVTPAEIAVSIAAQMIAHRAKNIKHDIKKSCMA